MGDSNEPLTSARRGAPQMALIYTVMVCVAMLIFIQFLLFDVTLKAYLAGKDQIVLPATIASGLCFAGSCWLIQYLRSPRTPSTELRRTVSTELSPTPLTGLCQPASAER